MNQLTLFVGGTIWFVLLIFINLAQADVPPAYYMNRWVFDAAGGPASSTGYGNLSAVAQSTPLGSAASSGYRNYPGFLHSVAAEGHLLPNYSILLSFAGAGTGWVTSFPVGIQCNVDCTAPFNSYFPVILTPTADHYMVFTGWSGGGCTGSAPCTMVLTGNTSVSATFEKDAEHSVYVPGETPGSGTYYPTLQAAYDAAGDGSAITAWATTYTENLNCGQPKSIVLRGGYDQNYTEQTGFTTLDGTLTLSQGAAIVERIILK